MHIKHPTQSKKEKFKHLNFTISPKKNINFNIKQTNQLHKHIQDAHCKAQALLKDLNPSLKRDFA
jgi:hypothetical protein